MTLIQYQQFHLWKNKFEQFIVIKNAPKWQPAVQNGRKVNAYKKQPITFVIEE